MTKGQNLTRQYDKDVICSFKTKCVNYPDECHHCKFNASLDVDNHLEFKDKNTKVRYLEET